MNPQELFTGIDKQVISVVVTKGKKNSVPAAYELREDHGLCGLPHVDRVGLGRLDRRWKKRVHLGAS